MKNSMLKRNANRVRVYCIESKGDLKTGMQANNYPHPNGSVKAVVS